MNRNNMAKLMICKLTIFLINYLILLSPHFPSFLFFRYDFGNCGDENNEEVCQDFENFLLSQQQQN